MVDDDLADEWVCEMVGLVRWCFENLLEKGGCRRRQQGDFVWFWFLGEEDFAQSSEVLRYVFSP